VRVPFIRGVVMAGAIALALAWSASRAQGGQVTKGPAPAPKVPAAKPQTGNKAGGGKQVAAEALERLLNMSPEERQKALSKLPPQQQKQLQTRLDNLERQTPEQRAQTLERTRQLEVLPPQRQKAVTSQIQSMNKLSFADQRQILNSPEFKQNFSPEEQQIVRERFTQAASNVERPIDKLVPARRQAVNQEAQRIRTTMTVPQRRAWLHSPEFSQQFSPEEQQIIRDRFPNAAK
jgi:hypothetical protein